jgi:hypothetical protein
MGMRDKIEKWLTYLEHIDFIAGVVKGLIGVGLGTILASIIGKVVELSGNWRLGVWLISSGIALWSVWKIASFFKNKRELVAKMIVYLPILLGIGLCVWAYVVGSTLSRTTRDVTKLRAEMNRYVLPRQLSAAQKETIAAILSKNTPQEIMMKVIKNDEGASSYRADLQQALEKGGWPVSTVDYGDDVQVGLRINSSGPMQPPQTAWDRLRPKPSAQQILGDALRQAGVQIDGTGGGSGIAITKFTLTVEIGHRRRDKWAIPPSPEQQKRMMSAGHLPDDPDD